MAETRPIDDVLSRLQARASGTGWSARCPAHDDRNPSLSISEGDDGRVLLKCHQGCSADEICSAIGLSARDLFVAEVQATTRRIVAMYDYRDERGADLFQVVRYDPKDFRQRRMVDGAWVWSTKDVRRVLYRLSEVLEAINHGRTVYVTEGEKDADALTRAGYTATCSPGGAGKWDKVTDAPQILAAAPHVVVVADDDLPGYEHARDVATSITEAGGTVSVVKAKIGKDAADHLGAGLTIDDFAPVDVVQVLAESPEGEEVELLEDWEPVDLGPALRGELKIPEPTVLLRTDGLGLLYRGQVNGLHGDSGTGKSILLAEAARQEIKAGNHVVWVDFEDPNEITIALRLLALCLQPAEITAQFHYLNPKTSASVLAVEKLCELVEEYEATLVVVDSIGEAFGLEGIDENADKEVGPWIRRVLRRVVETGAAVVAVDHGTKAADNPLYPSGSKRKRAAITGASYLITAIRSLTKEDGGALKITCAKDRHGNYGRGSVVAKVEFNSHPDDGLTVHVWPPTPGTDDEADIGVRLAARAATEAAKVHGQPVSQTELRTLMGAAGFKASNEKKIEGITLAVLKGSLKVDSGARQTQFHTYVKDFEMNGSGA